MLALVASMNKTIMLTCIVLVLLSSAFANGDDCVKHFQRYISDLLDKKVWAVSMFDATAKLQSGILSGNLANLGFFDQCLEISAATSDGQINGKYCLGSVTTNFNFSDNYMELSWGVCVPDSCEAADVAPIFLQLFSNYFDTTNLSLSFSSNLCQTKEQAYPLLSTGAATTLAILGVLVLIITISTALDVLKKSNDFSKTITAGFKCFSVLSNGQALFSPIKNEEQMSCLNGLKVISLFWIILLHEYSIFSAGPIENLRDLERWKDSLISRYEESGSLAVETFFVLSGFLLSYNYLKKMQAGKPFRLLQFYLHRIIRILPALAAVVLISATLLQYFGSGPYWYYLVTYFQKPCEEHWWSSLLFVENYVNINLMCVGHSWYLDVDMQLFFLSPLLLLPLRKYKKSTVTCIVLLIFASLAGSFFLSWSNDLIAMSNAIYGDQQLLNTTYYLRTHTRAPSWLIGFLCGILVHELKYKSLKLHTYQVAALWILSLTTFFTCSFGGYYSLRHTDYYKRFENALYITLNRPAFSVALCWIIFACIFGYGGILNKILSLSLLQIVSKLVYSMYLIHVTMMYVFVYSSKTSNRFSNVTLMHKFWGDCFFSMFMAIVSVLAFEYPAVKLEKLIF